MLISLLNLTGVEVRKIAEAQDGMGGTTTTTTLTTLSRANIWQPSSNDRFVSDKITASSTHVLALAYGEYTFTDDDKEVLHGGNTYRITGHADNVASRNELVIVGLERLS